jgi:hypothetical protein
MTYVYTIPARKKTEGERGGAAGGRAATPLRQREKSYFRKKSLNVFSTALLKLVHVLNGLEGNATAVSLNAVPRTLRQNSRTLCPLLSG